MPIAVKRPSVKGDFRRIGRGIQLKASSLGVMSTTSIVAKLEETEEKLQRLTTRRVFIVGGFGSSLVLGSSGVCRAESRTTKEGHEFFDPDELPSSSSPPHAASPKTARAMATNRTEAFFIPSPFWGVLALRESLYLAAPGPSRIIRR